MKADERRPTIVCKINGQEKVGSEDLTFGENISRIEVDQRIDAPAFFSVDLMIDDSCDPKKLRMLDELELGMEVEIQLGVEELNKVFHGEVSVIRPNFGSGAFVGTLEGYDYSHRLTRGSMSKTWGKGVNADQDLSTIAGDLINKSEAREGKSSDGLNAKKGSGGAKVPWHSVVNTNTFLALQQLKGGTGFAHDSSDPTDAKQVKFVSLEKAASPVITICRDKEQNDGAIVPSSAEFEMSTVRQVAKVEVRGYDVAAKKAIKGECTSPDQTFDGTIGPQAAGKAHWGSASSGAILSVVDRPVRDKEEADEVAKSIMNSLCMEFITGEIEIEGNSKVKAGAIIEVKEFGKAFDGKYVVTACRHVSSTSWYTTYISVARDASPG